MVMVIVQVSQFGYLVEVLLFIGCSASIAQFKPVEIVQLAVLVIKVRRDFAKVELGLLAFMTVQMHAKLVQDSITRPKLAEYTKFKIAR